MDRKVNRRRALQAVVFGTLAPWFATRSYAAAVTPLPIKSALGALEFARGGRLGVTLLDVDSGLHVGWRTTEHFGLCSTFKLPLAGLVLREADRDALRLDEFVPYGRSDLVPFSPVTEVELARGGMTVEALVRATQTTSDNTAANLLLGKLGGPAGFTSRLRDLGDTETRLDRLEPDLNRVQPREERDSTTPLAMARTVARLMTTDALSLESRARLKQWTLDTRTGLKRIRAGLPANWAAGDKTGTCIGAGLPKRINDVAIAWPPGRGPVIVTAYYESPDPTDAVTDQDESSLARVGSLAAEWITTVASGGML